MRSLLTDDFRAAFAALPTDVQVWARRVYRVWRANPYHPSLHFRQVHPTEPLYSVRIGLGWRALGLVEDQDITWFWIGSHAAYDHLIRAYQ